MDVSSPSIVRDPDKCILCGQCVRVCEEIQGVVAIDFVGRGCKAFIGTAFDQGLNVSSCINCGQCILVCPTGALTETLLRGRGRRGAGRPEQVRGRPARARPCRSRWPRSSASSPAQDVDGKMVAALRRIGFERVFDTSFTADLTIMEEGSELAAADQDRRRAADADQLLAGLDQVRRAVLPRVHPERLDLQEPAADDGRDHQELLRQAREASTRRKIVSVSIMPCTAKKFECARPEMAPDNVPDVDYVLTTRELGQLLRMFGVDLMAMEPETGRHARSASARRPGKIFGASGGVMEAAVRTAHFLLTGQELTGSKIQPLRGLKGSKELHTTIGGLEVGAAVVSGLGNARKLLEQIAGRAQGPPVHRGDDLSGRVHQRRRPADRRRHERRGRPHAGAVQDRPRTTCGSATRTRGCSGCTRSSWASRWARRAITCCTRTTPDGKCSSRIPGGRGGSPGRREWERSWK